MEQKPCDVIREAISPPALPTVSALAHASEYENVFHGRHRNEGIELGRIINRLKGGETDLWQTL